MYDMYTAQPDFLNPPCIYILLTRFYGWVIVRGVFKRFLKDKINVFYLKNWFKKIFCILVINKKHKKLDKAIVYWHNILQYFRVSLT